MAKNPTQWANNDVKAPAPVTPVTKNQSQWANNVTKSKTQYTQTGKGQTSWGHNTALQTYFYDDRFMYDDPLTTYDTLLNTNTSNPLGQTAWSAS